MKIKELILKYWKSWQKPDWEEMRSCLADQVDFGGQLLDADQFVGFCQQGSPWKEVVLFSSFFTEEGGAILYEGVDTVTEKRMRVGEFIRTKDGNIVSSIRRCCMKKIGKPLPII